MKFFFCFMVIVMQISALMYYGDVICVGKKEQIKEQVKQEPEALYLSKPIIINAPQCYINDDSGNDVSIINYTDQHIYNLTDENNKIHYILRAFIITSGGFYRLEQEDLKIEINKTDLNIDNFHPQYNNIDPTPDEIKALFSNPSEIHIVPYMTCVPYNEIEMISILQECFDEKDIIIDSIKKN